MTLHLRLSFAAAGLFLLVSNAAADDFPQPQNSGADSELAPLGAEQAAAGFRLPANFHAQVFASEPDVQNPVALAWDGKGRLWVAECYTYAERPTKFDLGLRDRVLIFADTNGDGRADERKVFCDNVQRLMSVEIGHGGVWLICLPHLLFVPDQNRDDIPDGPPQIVLDGFGISPDNYHNCANGLRWGPDGWLYGRSGASAPGRIGPPGAHDADRMPIFGGLWRYHPSRKIFETLCHGTTNPWGHDWDARGELFFTNTVTGHLFHMLPGAHYTRSATLPVNRFVYEPIDTHADHLHWDTGSGTSYKEVAHDQLGGGHAHCGAMIYLAHQWPAEYHGHLLTLNFHGRRLNVERLEREGSGFAARHEPDIAFAADTWFRGIDLTYGPDGSVYVLDWTDTGECHEHDGIHRKSGRIFRFVHGEPSPQSPPDLTRASLAELVALHAHENEWFVRQARRELAERAFWKTDIEPAIAALRRLAAQGQPDVVARLRVLWTLYTLNAITRESLIALLSDPDEHLRVWGLRLLTDHWPIDTVHGVVRATPNTIEADLLPRLQNLAASDPSGLVRLALTSTLQRIPLAERPALALAIASHEEFVADHNLPKLLWYGLAPFLEKDASALIPIAVQGKFPLTREWIARALAESPSKHALALEGLLREATPANETVRAAIVRGLVAGLAGRHRTDAPLAWPAFAVSLEGALPETQELVRKLSAIFGDGRALEEVREIALSDRKSTAERRLALETLIEARPDDLREICEQLLTVRFLNATALKALALFDDEKLGEQLARSYGRFHATERGVLIETLVTRPSFARALFDQIEKGKIAASEISALQARQIRSFGDESLTRRLSEVWGELRDSPQDKQDLIAGLKGKLVSDRLHSADLSNGRALFHTTCANCHRLYGTGGTVGPDITGSGRHNLEYLLGNIVDPSAVVNKDYRMSVLRLADGRVLNGVVISQDEERIVLQTAKERLTVLRSEVDEVAPSTLSVMPDGILQPLAEQQVRDLFAYLMGAGQVDFPAGFSPVPAEVSAGHER